MALRGDLVTVTNSNSPDDWLDADEVAALCGLSHGRVCQLLRAGLMPGRKLRGLFWQIRRRDALRHRQQPTGKGRPRGPRAARRR